MTWCLVKHSNNLTFYLTISQVAYDTGYIASSGRIIMDVELGKLWRDTAVV